MAGREMSDAEWAGLVARAAGPGLYGVVTTGVVCRTGCPARTPLRQNVLIFGDLEAAIAAEFRPCKRCRPERSRPPLQEIGDQPQPGGL